MSITKFTTMVRGINREKSSPLRIVSFSVHEGFQTELAKTGNEFIHVESPEGKKWDVDYREIPHNIIETSFESFLKTDAVDIVLSHTLAQRESISDFCKQLNIPHVSLMHCYPNPGFSDRMIEEIKAKNIADWNVFTTDDSMKEWGYSGEDNALVIKHAIDTDIFNCWNPSGPSVLTVANDYRERSSELGYDRYEILLKMFGENARIFNHVGKSPDGWSSPASSIKDLAKKYETNKIFLNTCHRSVLPTTLLEAMSTGMPVISASNPTISSLIKNGENGFVADDVNEIAKYIDLLLKDDELCAKIGMNARETVLNKFSIDQSSLSWNNLFGALLVENRRN